MEDIKVKRKSRFEKGSTSAKEFMATLRSKRGANKSITPTPEETPPPPPPTETPIPKRKSKNKITVDFL
jgi:hypothetical protein